MISILHIVSDDKFIDKHFERFQESGYRNDFVYLKKVFSYKGLHKSDLKWVKPFTREFGQLIDSANAYDVVFVYYLDHYKSYVVNQLKPTTRVIWHFFGAEIYNNKKYPFKAQLFSTQTKALLKGSYYSELLKEKVKDVLRQVLCGVKKRLVPVEEVNKAIGRVDYLAWYNEDEYKLIKSKVEIFPQFLFMPMISKIPELNITERDGTRLIIGNSCAPANNHTDVLQLLKEANFQGSVLIPFNYGKYAAYIDGIKRVVKSLPLNIKLLEGFMAYDEYVQMISSCGAAVFNSYRQMALGNIFILLANGVKIYLSERNPTYNWLKKEGFHVFLIEKDLKRDLERKDLMLAEEMAVENKRLYAKITDPGLNKKFVEDLAKLS